MGNLIKQIEFLQCSLKFEDQIHQYESVGTWDLNHVRPKVQRLKHISLLFFEGGRTRNEIMICGSNIDFTLDSAAPFCYSVRFTFITL